ncbi:MAG: class I SAM-dependent methyltransferase [Pseudomonas sp.]|uniref:class I SAM-dependent methyltransferase n=1 Tax=Pseudomonas sp. TaxID=306 RepID=UPI002FC9E397
MAINTDKGSAIYSPLVLKLYDTWVLGISNRFAWKCSTHEVLLPFFRRNVGLRHLDVGVGTGFYPCHAGLSQQTQITFMDLNPSSLKAASIRFGRGSTKTILHDVMTPLPAQEGGGYDSISLFYLLHCLPGNISDKGIVLSNLKSHLLPNGRLFGATILGDSANHNAFGKKLMTIYNRKGIFGNHCDTAEGLKAELEKHFASVNIRVEGKVALFEASNS